MENNESQVGVYKVHYTPCFKCYITYYFFILRVRRFYVVYSSHLFAQLINMYSVYCVHFKFLTLTCARFLEFLYVYLRKFQSKNVCAWFFLCHLYELKKVSQSAFQISALMHCKCHKDCTLLPSTISATEQQMPCNMRNGTQNELFFFIPDTLDGPVNISQ